MSKLVACGQVNLDGTHRAIIETDLPDFEALLRPVPGATRFLKLSNGQTTCGCLLAEVRQGKANVIYLDRFKQRHLGAKDGDLILVEEGQFPVAEKIKLQVPPDYSETDAARLIGKPVTKGEKTALFAFNGDPRPFAVADIGTTGIVVVGPKSIVTTAQLSDADAEDVPITYVDIGGLVREIRQLRENIEYPLRFPDLFKHLGVSQPKGILLYGPPGTGKTLLAKALANEVGAKFYSISGPEIFSKWYGETESNLREIFERAQKTAPSVILIDEIDSLVPRRDKAHGDLEQRVVASLLALMDGLRKLRGVVVIGTTNRVNTIDTALRREGRFGHEIHIGVPDLAGRKEILQIHTRQMPLAPEVMLDSIAERTVGFVGADIASLCREAAYNCLRRCFPPEAFEKGQELPCEGLSIAHSDFECALPKVRPSAMREFSVEIPKVSWEDIGGLEEVKRLLVENVAYAITKREVFKKVGVKPARGILLYGPPGTGKTLLAKGVASQCGANFISIKGPEIHSKWFGESEERIRFIFAKAREVAPCVIFFDEIDAAAPTRGRDMSGAADRIVNQILSEMDGIESTEGVFVIGATNRPELLDPAILRPGRFDYHLEIPLPDSLARKAILGVHLKGKPVAKDVDHDRLAELTDGFSGAEIEGACREAAWDAMRDAAWEAEKVRITASHLAKAMGKVRDARSKLQSKPSGSQRTG